MIADLPISMNGCLTVVRSARAAEGTSSYPMIETSSGTFIPVSFRALIAPSAMASFAAAIAVNPGFLPLSSSLMILLASVLEKSACSIPYSDMPDSLSAAMNPPSLSLSVDVPFFPPR